MIIERNCPSQADALRVTYDEGYDEFVVGNKETNTLCGNINFANKKVLAARIEELGREMFEAGYRRAQQDIRKALGMFP